MLSLPTVGNDGRGGLGPQPARCTVRPTGDADGHRRLVGLGRGLGGGRLPGVGEVATGAARRLHASVRTVTHRLARVAQLTGHRIARPDQRFSPHAVVLGARLLD